MAFELVIIKNDFPNMSPKMRKAVSKRVMAAGTRVEGGAKQKAPVDTGALRNSISSSMQGDLTAIIGVGMDYGGYVEFGTRYTPAQPYLGPAMDAERPRFEASCADLEGDLG